jgi:hypothetical protein
MKLKYLLITPIILIIFITVSCKRNKNLTVAKKIVTEWIGKEIKFPQNTECLKTDSLVPCPDISKENYKILLYIDSLGCTSCRFRLGEWKNIIEGTDILFSKKPDFIFVFQPKHSGDKEIKQLLKGNGFVYPIFLDVDNKTYALNNFPKEQEYQCFLLDKDNKVVMVGNPVLNPAIWKLYKKIILNNEE